jgi:hypothetical protein
MASLPGISQLEITPEILRLLMEDITDEQAHWKPAPDRWSIAEVLEHLSHTESRGFRARIDQMLAEEHPTLEAYDQEAFAAQGTYSGRDPEESFAHFEEQREDNVAFLRDLPLSVAERTGAHAKLGNITIGQLMNEWAFHDLGHIRQIAELVRVIRYHPHMGPFTNLYTVHP